MRYRDDDAVEPDHTVQHRHPADIRFCPLCGGEMKLRPVLPERRLFKVCSQCNYIDFPGPKIAAGCLVVERGRVLLLRRGIPPQLGLWTFPGGYVDFGESPAQAAIRETAEEVAIQAEVRRLHGVYTDPANPRVVVIVYLAEPGAGQPAVSAEATEVRYFAADEIPWDEVAFRTTHQALTDWVATAGRG